MPKEPPDVLADHAHLALGETEMLGEQVLHHVRRLRALIHGQALLSRIPIGEDRARFQTDAGVAAEDEFGFDDRVGARESLVDFADLEPPLEREIVAEFGMDRRRSRR